jgi:acyl-CoA thioesterase I
MELAATHPHQGGSLKKIFTAVACGTCVIAVFAVSAQAQIRFACIGNSITAGSYPSMLQTKLGNGYLVENDGVSGTTMLKLGDSPYWTNGRLPQVFAFQPDIVTIKLGTNDTKPQNWDVHGADFKKDYQAMIDTLNTLASKPKIFLVVPVPIWTNGYGIRNDIMQFIIPILKQIATERNLTVIDCNTPLINRPDLFPDGVHPNGEGADSIATIIYRSILGIPLFRVSDSLVTLSCTIGLPRTPQVGLVSVVDLNRTSPAALTATNKRSWLTVHVDATKPDSQVITNTADASSLPDVEQKYYDTVTIHSAAAGVTDMTYRVLLWIRPAPVFTSVSIVPADSGAIPSSKPYRFTAAALDQYGTPIPQQPAFSWQATGGSVSLNGLFTPSGSSAAGRVIASAQGFADTIRFSIVQCSQKISYDYFPHVWISDVGGIASLTGAQSGTSATISESPTTTIADSFALRFSGYIMIPTTGAYFFYTNSDDGSALFIDGNKVVDNDGIHGPQERSGSVALGWGLHAISALFFEQAGGQILTVSWQGPGIGRSAIPDSLFFHDNGSTAAIQKRFAQENLASAHAGSFDLSVSNRGISIAAAVDMRWELGLFALDGTRVMQQAGRGSCVLPAVGNRGNDNRFIIARLRTPAGDCARVVMPALLHEDNLPIP